MSGFCMFLYCTGMRVRLPRFGGYALQDGGAQSSCASRRPAASFPPDACLPSAAPSGPSSTRRFVGHDRRAPDSGRRPGVFCVSVTASDPDLAKKQHPPDQRWPGDAARSEASAVFRASPGASSPSSLSDAPPVVLVRSGGFGRGRCAGTVEPATILGWILVHPTGVQSSSTRSWSRWRWCSSWR